MQPPYDRDPHYMHSASPPPPGIDPYYENRSHPDMIYPPPPSSQGFNNDPYGYPGQSPYGPPHTGSVHHDMPNDLGSHFQSSRAHSLASSMQYGPQQPRQSYMESPRHRPDLGPPPAHERDGSIYGHGSRYQGSDVESLAPTQAQPHLFEGSEYEGGNRENGDAQKQIVLYQIITQDLNNIRAKVGDYLGMMRSPSRALTDHDIGEEQEERRQLQDAVFRLEEQQRQLADILEQRGIDVNSIPINNPPPGYARSIARSGSYNGSEQYPDRAGSPSYSMSMTHREHQLQSSINKIEEQQQALLRMMKDEYDDGDDANRSDHNDRNMESRADRLRTFADSSQGYNNPNGNSRQSLSRPDLNQGNEKEYRARELPTTIQEEKEHGQQNWDDADEADPKDPKPYHRKTRMNYPGILVFILYLLALLFYIYIRCRYTLNLGQILWYGIIVFLCEMMGAVSILLYSICIIVKPLDNNKRRDPTKPCPRPKLKYHVRVIVPCYSESLQIVQRTVLASYNAHLPPNVSRTVYLCDDGKDPKKQEWVEQMDTDDIIYVSGRKRKPGEMNGKSCNINNCLKQIYPKSPKQGIISLREIVCIFDADQVASKEFFNKTVYLLDSGTNLGMVLSPQCFHNINPGADIFNCSNIHFWEYMQPGYDAFGFISCTGTNFLVRAKALQDCGWFPENTVTEDFGLGIELTKRNWQCRYVQEYLAIGEAPEEVRNCMQQRSRWAKGHFQIFYSSACPLFDKGLPIPHRIFACSSIWSYVTCAITTPILLLVPIFSIWLGFFPIALNWWTALGLTVYFGCTQFVKFYHQSARHIRVLWFSDLANTILFFVFMKAMVNTLIACIAGKSLSFKVTTKGKGNVAAALRQIWLHIILFLLNFITVILALASVSSRVNLPLVLSILWTFYNTIPFYLILHYAYIGRNNSLKWACWIGMFLMMVAGILSIFLVWFLLPSQYDYANALRLSINFYDNSRAGQITNNPTVPAPANWRGSTPSAINCASLTTRNISQTCPPGLGSNTGFLQMGGQLGNMVFTVPIAYTVAMLSWSITFTPNAYQKGWNGNSLTQYTQQQIQWGGDYLLNTVSMNGNNVQYVIDFIGNPFFEINNNWYRIDAPASYFPNGWQYKAHTATQGYQIFADIAAGLAAASYSLQTASSTANLTQYTAMANTLYSVAKASESNNQQYKVAAQTDYIPQSDSSSVSSFQSSDIYVSSTQYDDLCWAAAWLSIASTQNGQFNNDFATWQQAYVTTDIQNSLSNNQYFNWDNLYFGALALQMQVGASADYEESLFTNLIRPWVCGATASVKYTWSGRAWSSQAGTLSDTMNVAFLTMVFATYAKGPPTNQVRLRYRCYAQTQARYILGDSQKYTYQEGYPPQGKAFGSYKPKTVTQTFSRIAACPLDLGCGTSGIPSTADKQGLQGALLYGPYTQASSLSTNAQPTDDFSNSRSKSNFNTWPALEYNAGWQGAVAAIIDTEVDWAECLQGFGIKNFKYQPECSYSQ